MPKLLLFSLMLLSYFISIGQHQIISGKPRKLTRKEITDDEKNQNCFYHHKYSALQRLKFFPFNQAKEIRLVSFAQPDSIITGGEITMNKGIVDISKLKESRVISHADINILTDLLYNRGFGGPFYTFSKSLCYNPRNAILFLDLHGKVFAFIELCFECHGHRLNPQKVKAGDFCNQKYELLRSFFATHGIKYGTSRDF